MLTNVRQIDQGTLYDVLKFSIKTGGNMVSIGPAGIGKTEMAISAAAEMGYEACYLNLSVMEAPDLVGLPQVTADGRTSYAPPENIPMFDTDKKKVVLVVDELDKAKPELQNPCLELFQTRSMNSRPFNIHAIIATSNMPDEGSFSLPMSHALMNRCLVYQVTHAFDPWHKWAVKAGVNPLIIGFLSKNPEFLLKPPASGDSTAYAHESPRAWTLAARDLDHTSSNDSVEFQTLLVSGRVGMSGAVAFQVWLEHYRHIEPLIDALLKDGTHPNVKSMNIDRVLVCAIASMSAIASKCREKLVDSVAKDKLKKEIYRMTKNVSLWLEKIPTEFCIGAVKNTMNSEMIQAWELHSVPEFVKVFMNIQKALKDF